VHIRDGLMCVHEPSGQLLARIERVQNRLYVLNINIAWLVCLAAHGEENAWC
jgi:hypothetical protein